jgi:lysophospholipid acyltransferase (LPLAT)-like uncharacterized protein
MKNILRMTVLPFAASVFVRLLHATLRVRHAGVERGERLPQCIIAFWHAHIPMMLHSRYRKPITVLSSRSRDGEISARVFGFFGVNVSRGSSTRGGTAALRELLRLARDGHSIVFTPDGPKGPARVAKDGVVYTAKMTGLPIVPIAFAAKKKSCCTRGIAWRFRSRSRKRSSSTARRSSCRVTATSTSGGGEWKAL